MNHAAALLLAYSLRNQIDALILTLQEGTGEPQKCEHPMPHRTPVGNFGDPSFRCGACGEIVNGEAAA